MRLDRLVRDLMRSVSRPYLSGRHTSPSADVRSGSAASLPAAGDRSQPLTNRGVGGKQPLGKRALKSPPRHLAEACRKAARKVLVRAVELLSDS